MTITRKVFMCKLGSNEELDTAEKWRHKFALSNFSSNIVSHDLDTGEYKLVNNIVQQIQEEEDERVIKHEYFFLIVEQIGTFEFNNTNKSYVSGYFAKASRYLNTVVDFENGNINEENLRLRQAGSTSSRFLYIINSRLLFYEYNKNGVSFFDGRFYRYLDTIFGEDIIKIHPIMRDNTMEEAIRENLVKKMTFKVAASNVRFVNRIIGLSIPQRFANSLGDENYNITITICSNRKSKLGADFVRKIVNNFRAFRRKDEISKLEFITDDDEPLILTKDLRLSFERSFQTNNHRSKMLQESDFRTKTIQYHNQNQATINGAIE